MKNLIFKILLLVCFFQGYAQVTADFETTGDKTGCAPFVVNFLDLSSDATQWAWDFGNGVTSNLQNPTYVFSEPGFYTITLTASDGIESDTEVKSALIRVNASPIADFTVDNENGCSPHLAQFTDISIPVSGTVTEWFWAFGNGESSTEQHPLTTYSEIKDYDVFLKVKDINGCEASVSKSSFIKLDGPEAKFLYDSVVCGLPADVTFLNLSSGSDLEYLWDFGDGTTATGDVPGTHTYTSFDSSMVSLIVTEKKTGCKDAAQSSIIVGDYQAEFDWNIICGDGEYTVEVENKTNIYNSLKWEFTGGPDQFGKNATHHFNSRGPHAITLRAEIDGSCWDTTTIIYNLPSLNFTYSASICSDPFEVTFVNLSNGKALDYNWDFGDTTYSKEINPIHIYDIPPEQFPVKLYAEDQFGCIDSTGRNVQVPFPIARFYEEDSVYTGCAPLDLTFKDTSYTLDADISSVKWDFGDPASGSLNTSTEASPSHLFSAPGDYDITYIIFTDDGCSDTAVFEAAIKAGEKPILANFEQLANDTICYGESINFVESASYATSTLESNYFCWAFEEDGSSLLPDPESPPLKCKHPPAIAGTKEPYVHISNPTHKYDEFEHIADTLTPLIYTGTIDPNAGNLFTHLIIGYNNCLTEVINPTFVDTTIAINGYAIEDSLELFSDSTLTVGLYQASLNYDSIAFSYVYSNKSSDTLFKIHETDTNFFSFQEGQTYVLRTKVVNKSSGCENEIADVFKVDSVRMSFEMTDKHCFNDTAVLLDDNSNSKFGRIVNRQWFANDKLIVTNVREDSSYYSFPDTGIFEVKLVNTYEITYTKYGKAKKGYYSKEITKTIKIEGVIAKGFSDTLTICGGETIQFTDTSKSTTSITNYEWYFGYDTDSSVLKNPTHTYYEAGDYNATLKVFDSFGCMDSLVLPAINVKKPFVEFEVSDSLICIGENIRIENNSEGEALSPTWTINGLTLFFEDPVVSFDASGFYDIKLHAVDTFGCSDSLTKINRIEVAPFPDIIFEGDPLYSTCPPMSSFFGDSTLIANVKWNWDFGDGRTSTDQHPSHIYTEPGVYDITLVATNYGGCADTIVKEDYVTVDGPNGTVSFDPDTICIPDSVVFDVDFEKTLYFIMSYGDGSNVSYNYADNPDTTIYIYRNGGEFQPKVELIDAAGCFYTLPQPPKILGDSIKALFETSSDIICDVSNIPFTNISRSSFESSFVWTFGDGDSTSVISPLHSYLTDSVYNVKLVQTSPLGCKDSIEKSLTVFNAPYPEIEISGKDFCIPTSTEYKLNFSNKNFTADSIYFIINGGEKIYGDSIVESFNSKGDYSIKYTIDYGSGNCSVDSTLIKKYYNIPVANFSFSPNNNSIDEPVVFFTDLSTNTTIWNWDFNDGENATVQSPGHSFDFADSYKVRLIASNEGGCFDTLVQTVSIAPFDFVKLPSAFSPNGDGENDVFHVLRAGELDIIEFKIFNRWGNVVFETNDKNEGWDGTRKGKEQNTGTYIYYLKGTNGDGEIIEIKGNFTLLR